MPTSHVFYHRSPAHSNAYVLSFAFCFDKENENYQFSMCQPYTYSRHKVTLGLNVRSFEYLFQTNIQFRKKGTS